MNSAEIAALAFTVPNFEFTYADVSDSDKDGLSSIGMGLSIGMGWSFTNPNGDITSSNVRYMDPAEETWNTVTDLTMFLTVDNKRHSSYAPLVI